MSNGFHAPEHPRHLYTSMPSRVTSRYATKTTQDLISLGEQKQNKTKPQRFDNTSRRTC